jgi:hypothetical protein
MLMSVEKDIRAAIGEQSSHVDVVGQLFERVVDEHDPISVERPSAVACMTIDLRLSEEEVPLVCEHRIILRLVGATKPRGIKTDDVDEFGNVRK